MTEDKIEQVKLKHSERNLLLFNQNNELVSMYDEYVGKIVELFDFIKKNDSDLFYTLVFNILLEVGFFSADRRLEYNDEEYPELLFRPGMNIVYGKGQCRNVAFFYEDIFAYFCNYPLKACCFDKNFADDEKTNTYGNHVINLTNYEGITYGFDLTNHCAFRIKDPNTFSGVGFDYLLEYKPNGDLLLDLTTGLDKKSYFLKEKKIKDYLFKIAAQNNILSLEHYKKLVNDANIFIRERKPLFQSFLQNNEELTHEIKKKMLSLK